jgi:ethanolamine utilization cobalamin adenosyltransferase
LGDFAVNGTNLFIFDSAMAISVKLMKMHVASLFGMGVDGFHRESHQPKPYFALPAARHGDFLVRLALMTVD